MPGQLSALSDLLILDISYNPLSLRIPLAYTSLTHLVAFDGRYTWLCVPNDSAFLNWVASVPNWQSPGLCHTISGHVTRPGGVVANVVISDGYVHSTSTDITGAYTLLDLPPASYNLTATSPGRYFLPVALTANVSNADLTGQDFHEAFAISGLVTLAGKPLANAAVSDGSGHSVITGPDGAYTLAFLPPGDYLITVNLPGLRFAPPSVQVSISSTSISGVDFYALFTLFMAQITRP